MTDLTAREIEVLGWLDTAYRTAKGKARALEAIPRLSEVNLSLLGATAAAADLTEMGCAIQNEMTGDFRISALGEFVLREALRQETGS